MFSRQIAVPARLAANAMRASRLAMARESDFVAGELAQLRGMVALMIRFGSSSALSEPERALLVAQLRRASSLSPYLIVALLPGSFAFLPILVLLRDRRRNRPRRVA